MNIMARQKAKEFNLCQSCGMRPLAPLRSSCQVCLDRGREYRSLVRSKRDRKEYLKRWRADKKFNKICTICGERPLTNGSTTKCTECRETTSKSIIERYKNRKENKICVRCKQPTNGFSKCSQCATEANVSHTKNRNNTKIAVFNHYSIDEIWKCNCCGEDFYEFLTIDHVENNGASHRKEMGSKKGSGHLLYRWLQINNFPVGYQILCWNCQWSKHLHGKCQCQDYKNKRKLVEY